jgi:diguanylate cyclase (GGDEF)-like protein|nr:GGDEF domain-containing phosphodiesterase [Neorhizobium tomejilense]
MNLKIFSMMRARAGEAEFGNELAMYYRKPFLETLFSGRWALFHGFIGQVGACTIAYWATSDLFYLYYILLAAAVLLARQVQFTLYDRRSEHLLSDDSTEAEINRWYLWYITASSTTSSVVGCLTAYSVAVHPGTWATAIPLALTLGTMVAAVGRNYGNSMNVTMIVVCSFAPCIAAFLYHAFSSGNYVIGIGGACLLVPFMMATRDMARAVMLQLNGALTSKQEADILREQFYNAVSNMPNGLLMVEHDGRIKFANSPAKRMFGIPEDHKFGGEPLESIFKFGLQLGDEESVQFGSRLHNLFRGMSHSEVLKFSEDFQVEFTIKQETSDRINLRFHRQDGFVIVCEDVTKRIHTEQRVRYSANIDGLSDIPNRSHMRELVEEARTSRMKGRNLYMALCVFDVDKFKTINDTLGHAVGDEVIRAVARSMKELKEKTPNLIISRLGGDEFVMILPNVTESFDPDRFFDHAFGVICRTYDMGNKSVEVRCSGGVIVVPKIGFNLDDAMNKADLALYKVKQEKKDRKDSTQRWTLFDTNLEQVYRNKQQMRSELQMAVRRGQMVVEYQPMYTPDGSRIDTCEALCRWQHPELGTLGPDHFIGIAESMNLIADITRHMITTACMDCASWDDDTCVSVNLSVLDLAHFEIVEVISDALRTSKLPASRLQVEITESILIKESDKACQILNALKSLGVRTAMDDFGTGYANLSAINELPLDKMKIDRSFVRKIATEDKSRTLFAAMVQLGKNMGLDIVVEGVENADQLEQVKKAEIDLIQGYLFGKPMSSKEIGDVISSRKAAVPGSNVIPIPLASRSAH